MSLAPDLEVPSEVPSFRLSDRARGQLEERGITRSQLLRVLLKPVLSIPGLSEGERRLSGYGLTVLTGRGADGGVEVLGLEIDGATRTNWDAWAVENAEFGDGDVVGADALLRTVAGKGARTLQEPAQTVSVRQIPVQLRSGPLRAPRRQERAPRPVREPLWASRAAGRAKPALADRFPKAFLDQINPELHEDVIFDCDGDFFRVIVHSWDDVEILPPFEE